MIVKRLRPGDEAIVERLAEQDPPRTALLQDDATIFLVALDRERVLGFVFGYELPRRHGDESIFFVYEVDVDVACRRQGVATRLMNELRRICRERGIAGGFVLTDADNVAANALYASADGTSQDVVMWDFRYADG